jgi:hypothetical protein
MFLRVLENRALRRIYGCKGRGNAATMLEEIM